jgi:hypothetical protein
MPKMDFPHFDGSDVRVWLDKCPAYFHIYGIPPNFSVTIASLHMAEKTSHWVYNYKHYASSHTWEHFVVAVSREFEVDTHRVKIMELLNMRQMIQLKVTKISLISWCIIFACMTINSVRLC